ncbi:MAG TPA: RNA polymerase sigma factor [Polyangia bacterium]|jgi:RNA polymerase sigma-70 factor (ECF subfamily)|nr:RNA polymerase sigma factor [Polyangia bacterium]
MARVSERDGELARVHRHPAADAGPSDAELVARIVGGNRQAQALLYARHAPPLAGLLVRLLGSRADAEDALHDTFIIAFDKLRALREPAALYGWLQRIAVAQAHRRFRRLRLLRLFGFTLPPGDSGLAQLATQAASPEVRTELGLVDEQLRRIAARERAAWILRHVEGYELSEVARLCDCSLATAKRRIAAAERAIAQHTTGLADAEDGDE